MKYSEYEIAFLNKYYPLNGRKYCADKLNRSYQSIARKASELHLKVESNVDPMQFINPSKPEVVYILGFLWADGFIYSKKYINIVNTEIKLTDAEALYPIFRKTGKWTFCARTRKNRQPQGLITTSNKNLCKFLYSHNYIPHSTKPPNNNKYNPRSFKIYIF